MNRNLAIEKSSGDYVAFIDDDEYPASDWLYNLYVIPKAYDCDIVHGPGFPYDNRLCFHFRNELN